VVLAPFVFLVLCAAGVPSFAQPPPSSLSGPLPDLSHPLTVDDLVRIAVQRNLDFAQAREAVEGAIGSRTGSLSGLLPNLNGSYSFTRRGANGLFVDPSTGIAFRATGYSSTYGLTVRGGANIIDLPSIYDYRGARFGVNSARQSLAASRSATVLQVEQQYYAVIQAQQIANVNEEAYNLALDQLKRTQSLFELGSVARADVLQAQVNVASAERDRISAENAIEQQRSALAILIAVPVESPIQLADPPPVADSIAIAPEPELIAQAEANRPEVKRAYQDLLASRSSNLAARALRYPSISGTYSYSKQGAQAGDVLKDLNHDSNWGFALALSVPIFDGLATKGQIERTSAEVRARQDVLEKARLQVALDVREAVLAMRNAMQEIRSARQGVSYAEESVRLQQALYENGGGTLLEWTNAQVELTRARQALVAAENDLRIAQAGLASALGEYAQ
jgi:outer membrane protein